MGLAALLGTLGVARLFGGSRRLHHAGEVGQELGTVVETGVLVLVGRDGDAPRVIAVRAMRAVVLPGGFAGLGLVIGHVALPRSQDRHPGPGISVPCTWVG